MAEKDGELHEFYDQYNKLEGVGEVMVAFVEQQPVACGTFKAWDQTTVEIKRMFTLEAYRRRGIAAQVLQALETWAYSEGYRRAVLETGKQMKAAIRLYSRCGYRPTQNFGPYAGVDESICFEKDLSIDPVI